MNNDEVNIDKRRKRDARHNSKAEIEKTLMLHPFNYKILIFSDIGKEKPRSDFLVKFNFSNPLTIQELSSLLNAIGISDLT